MGRVAHSSDVVVVAKTDPAKLKAAFRAYESQQAVIDVGSNAKLTCHVVAAIVLLNVPRTSGTRTLLGQLPDRLQTRFFLCSLVSLLATRRSIFKLLTSFAFMPCVLVDDADFVSTCYACKDVAFDTAHVDLTGVTRSTPSEVGCAIVSF